MGAKRHVAIVMPTDPAVLGYLAGLLDGEGTVGISSVRSARAKNPSHFPHLMIANCYEPVMRWLERDIGGKVDIHTPSTNQPHWRTSYRWRLHGQNAEAFLRSVRPYLRIKHEQADVVLAMSEIRGKNHVPHGTLTGEQVELREGFKRRINELNRRGTS